MKATAEPGLAVRVGPSPDPIPYASHSRWTVHAPWVLTLVGVGAAVWGLGPHDLGLLACGAALVSIAVAAACGWIRTTCHAAHLTGGVIALTAFRSPEEAGTFTLAAGTVAVGAMIARAWALRLRSGVAPLAGRLPWRFQTSFRAMTHSFGLAGLAVGASFAFFGPDPLLRVVGVAMFPLALRSSIGHLLARKTTRVIWCLALAVHITILASFVPTYGAMAAAWALVVTETILFAGQALLVARRTGVTPLPPVQLAAFCCAALLIVLLTIPNSAGWLLLAGIALGIAAGAFFRPRRRGWKRKTG
ncbi:MAG: hypothetical protein ACYS6Z_06340 [Planctomycetota bacterium]|jgi:hypothetical protein